MTSIQPEIPEEEDITNELETGEEIQPEERLGQHQQRTADQEGISSGPIIINR